MPNMIRVRNGANVRVIKESEDIIDGLFIQPGSEYVLPNNAQVDALLAAGVVEVIEWRFRTVSSFPSITAKEEAEFPPEEKVIPESTYRPVKKSGKKKYGERGA